MCPTNMIARNTGAEYAVEVTRDEDGYFLRIPDLPGCESNGLTLEDAFASIEEARRSWVEAAIEAGRPVPAPRAESDYSGRFVVRVGSSLHRDLVRLARLEGVSLNSFVASALARVAGRTDARS